LIILLKRIYQYDIDETSLEISRKLRTFHLVKEKNLFRLLYQTNPEYIIVDNPLDHLDQESRKTITITLQQLAKKRS
jgi:molybdate transport system ATP-binding protein